MADSLAKEGASRMSLFVDLLKSSLHATFFTVVSMIMMMMMIETEVEGRYLSSLFCCFHQVSPVNTTILDSQTQKYKLRTFLSN